MSNSGDVERAPAGEPEVRAEASAERALDASAGDVLRPRAPAFTSERQTPVPFAPRTWQAPPPRASEWRPARRMPPVRRDADEPRWLRFTALTAKVAALLFIGYALMFNFSIVRGSSMAPGIHDGDRILVDHLSYVFQDVNRGDIVVLQYPLDPSLDYIKRVIGVPGDHVEIEGGTVWVNDVRLAEPYVSDRDPRTRLSAIVQPEHFFVLGDNRPHSSDSREFGQVPRDHLRGKVEVRVWPPERIGTLD
jgi:signal peptidase I